MKDWSQYSKTHQEITKLAGQTPSAWGYVLIKATDNAIAIAVLILTLIFAFVGLFYFDAASTEKNWALHAAELCLGVFLGLLKSDKKS